MKTLRKISHYILGILGVILATLSIYIISGILMYYTKEYFIISIVLIIITIMDIERHYYLKNKGFKPEIGKYTKSSVR